MKKIIFGAVAIVLATLFLVTCDILFPPDGDGEWTDVEYSRDGRLLTVYLRPDGLSEDARPGPDTYGVQRTVAQRALTLELAKMGHDYFEAVFVSTGAGTGATTAYARAAWEIGTPAGISGVGRGFDYKTVTGGTTAGTAAAVLFVGKKMGKTLMGIGHIVRVDNTWVPTGTTATAVIGSGAKSVTFGVYPLTTEVGYINTTPTAAAPTWELRPGQTFLTNAKTPTATAPSVGDTLGQNISLAASVEYPLFTLPEVSPTHNWGPPPPGTPTPPIILASYKIGGMAAGTIAGIAGTGDANKDIPADVLADKPDLLAAAMRAAPLEIMKRNPSYIYKGQTFDAVGEVIDQYTDVKPTNNETAIANVSALTVFLNPITMRFIQDKRSTGIFAITFQVPVYAITAAPYDTTTYELLNSTNGGPPATRWYIRPGYNQYQYLLDDGEAAGGAVMLGAGVSGLDWLDIFTVGMGFTN